MLKKIINDILLEYDIDISNFWTKFFIGYILVCFCLILYFSTIFPIILSLQNNEIAKNQETRIMYLIHSIYSESDRITYFNMFPIIGGDRIFVVRSTKTALKDTLEKHNWHISHKEDTYEANKDNYVAAFTEGKEDVLLIGGINGQWSELWYNIYKLYYL